MGNSLSSGIGIEGAIGTGLISGGMGFLSGGFGSLITTGEWNWTGAIIGGVTAGLQGYASAENNQIDWVQVGNMRRLNIDMPTNGLIAYTLFPDEIDLFDPDKKTNIGNNQSKFRKYLDDKGSNLNILRKRANIATIAVRQDTNDGLILSPDGTRALGINYVIKGGPRGWQNYLYLSAKAANYEGVLEKVFNHELMHAILNCNGWLSLISTSYIGTSERICHLVGLHYSPNKYWMWLENNFLKNNYLKYQYIDKYYYDFIPEWFPKGY